MDCKFVKLSELCTITPGTALKPAEIVSGNYPIISDDEKAVGFHHQFNMTENIITIICGTTVENANNLGTVKQHEMKIFVTDNCYCLLDIDGVNTDYLYYYLQKVHKKIKKLGTNMESDPKIAPERSR